MKICLLGLENLPVLAPEYSAFYFGGEQVQQTLLAKALRAQGYDVCMVTGDYGQEDGKVWEGIRTYKAFRFDSGIPVIRFLYPRWVKLWAALKRADADVYYTSCAGMQVGMLALFCKRYDRRFIFRLASDGDADPARLMIRYRRDKVLYRYGLKRADCILAQHENQQSDLKSNFGVQSSIASMFVEKIERRYSLNERNIDILWVSNIQEIKRPEIMIELAKRMPHLRFSMVGGKMTGAENFFKMIKHKTTLLQNVTFYGAVPFREIGNYFDRARIFINTSILEGFPNTFLQAWRRGVPVISFFDPGKLIAREGLGKVVNTIDEMSFAVEQLLNNHSMWENISNKAYDYVENHFDEKKVIQEYCEAIDKVYRRTKTIDG